MHTNKYVALKPNLMSFLLLWSVFLLTVVSYFIIFIIKILKFLFLVFLVWNPLLSLYAMLKVSKTTCPQKLFPSDCITLYGIGSPIPLP